jgi:hypothetical protein
MQEISLDLQFHRVFVNQEIPIKRVKAAALDHHARALVLVTSAREVQRAAA